MHEKSHYLFENVMLSSFIRSVQVHKVTCALAVFVSYSSDKKHKTHSKSTTHKLSVYLFILCFF